MKKALLSCLLLVTLPAFAADPAPIEKSVASPERTAADRERDKRDKPGRYGLLTGVAVDETGRVYLVDQLFGKVEVIRRLSEAEGHRLQAAG